MTSRIAQSRSASRLVVTNPWARADKPLMRWMRRTLGTPLVTKQPFNLKNMIDVMSGHMTSEIAYRHATTLLVVSFAFGVNRVNKGRLASRNNRNISKASRTLHEP